MTKAKNKNYRHDMKSNSISIKKFLRVYCGVEDYNIYNSKLSHQDIKDLFPYLKRVSFNSVISEKEEMYLGSIISVVDSYGNIAPYIKPTTLISDLGELTLVDSDESKAENLKQTSAIEEIILSENLSNYELRCLKEKYKQLRDYNKYRIVIRLLRQKNATTNNYKIKKLVLKMEDMSND